MRIITGSAKGKRLSAPEGADTRPTSELVKEAVFSMIQFEIEGAAVLDLFAGSGQMGLEALSRGAKSCVFIDNSKNAFQVISGNIKASGFASRSRAARADAISWLGTASNADRCDIAFLDPPYRQNLLVKALPLVSSIMNENGIIICEASKDDSLPPSAGRFQKYREYKYGSTIIAQYRMS